LTRFSTARLIGRESELGGYRIQVELYHLLDDLSEAQCHLCSLLSFDVIEDQNLGRFFFNPFDALDLQSLHVNVSRKPNKTQGSLAIFFLRLLTSIFDD